jgi:hypothetical protein
MVDEVIGPLPQIAPRKLCEVGADMARFLTVKHFTSWFGFVRGDQEFGAARAHHRGLWPRATKPEPCTG